MTPPLAAETYYVRASGSDDLDGLSPQTAFASIRFAGGFLREPGDRVIVGPGVYAEGNITPQRSGTPDVPIVFQADVSGTLTQDSAGPVLILPPNAPEPPDLEDNRTGFLLFGKHDIVIEGFTIAGAADAGIQVRPHSSTGIDSTRITIRNNVIRNGGQRGIHAIAAGDVTVADNVVHDNADAGVALLGGMSGDLRPLVTGNVIERNQVGIGLERTSDAMISDNRLHANARGIGVIASDRVTIRGNDIDARNDIMRVGSNGTRPSRDLEIVSNDLRGGEQASYVSASGAITYEMNRFTDENVQYITLDLGLDADAIVRFTNNELGRVALRGGSELDVIGNTGERFGGSVSGPIRAFDNSFTRRLLLFGTGELEVSRNRFSTLEARGGDIVFTDNEIGRSAELVSRAATVTDNRGGSLSVLHERSPTSPNTKDETKGTFVIERNVTDYSLSAGWGSPPLPQPVIRDNSIGGIIRINAHGQTLVTHNQSAGIASVLFEPDPDLFLIDNTSSGSATSGFVVVGARDAFITGNASSANKKHGISIRRTRKIIIIDNTFLTNERGGIGVERAIAIGGDCNEDGEVTVDEVVIGIAIAFAQLDLSDCEAIDFNGDGVVTIDEIVRTIGEMLGLIAVAPTEEPDSEILIHSNRIEDNSAFGINVAAPGSVSAIENVLLRNGGIGIAADVNHTRQEIDIVGNWIGSGAAEGILLSGTSKARIQNNLVFSNGQSGILLRDAPGVSIVNNLIYHNGNDGIGIGVGTTRPSPDAVVSNNTLYANAGWGVTIGTAGAPSEGTVVMNNIIDRNGRGGIAAQLESLVGLNIGFNLNNDGYSHEVAPSVTDFPADPRFIDPTGQDGILGNAGFADDDFHIDKASAAVDSGSATASELGITGSVVAGLDADEGIVDMGFHYGAELPEGPVSK
jgi:parallel beta-helix repeat protein